MRLHWLCLAATVAGCSEHEFNVVPVAPPVSDLTISGRVCHPVTHTWLPNALVYTNLYDDNDVVYDSRSDTTDALGAYLLTDLVAEKDYQIYVQVGHDIIDSYIVGLGVDSVEVPPPECAANNELSVAVISFYQLVSAAST